MKIGKYLKFSILLSIPAMIISIVSTSAAWYSNAHEEEVGMEATVHGSYFESGDGSAETPFEIHRPIQLYYFSWLQGLGFFNEPTAIGATTIKQYHFYLSDNLNMEGITLPPVGTQDYPFVGTFTSGDPVKDEHGIVIGFTEKSGTDCYSINNLNISNDTSSYDDKPAQEIEASEIVGFFGVVGSLDADNTETTVTNTTNAKVNDVKTPNYTYSVADNYVRNFYIDGCSIKTQTDNALIGIAVGYLNAPVENVGVANSNLFIKTSTSPLTDLSNLSDYSIVGYAADLYVVEDERDPTKTKITVNSGVREVPEAESGDSWGGSINMQSIYKRIDSIYTTSRAKTAANSRYETSVTTEYDSSGQQIGESISQTKTMNNYPYPSGQRLDSTARFYNSESANGSYAVNYRNDENRNGYCMGGMADLEMHQDIRIYHTGEYDEGFVIGSENYVFSLNNDNTNIIESTDVENATIWKLEDGAIYHQDDKGLRYYLNAYLPRFSISDTQSTSWTINQTDEYTAIISCVLDGHTFYITEVQNKWTLVANNASFIAYNSNYIRAASETTISNTTDMNQASIFYYTSTSQGNIYTYYNGARRYIYWDSNNSSNPLALSNTNSQGSATRYHYNWTINSNGIYYDSNHFMILVNNVWTCGPEIAYTYTYKIASGSNYLKANSSYSGFESTASASAATEWNIDDNGRIYVVANNKTYYVRRYNNNLSLSTTNSYNTWTISNKEGTGTYSYSTSIFTPKRYLSYQGNSWSVNTSSTNLTTTPIPHASTPAQKGILSSCEFDTSLYVQAASFEKIERQIDTTPGGFPCYMPINASETADWTVKNTNTGYIISGSNESTDRRSDIRITHWDTSYVGTALDSNLKIVDSNVRTFDGTDHTINVNNYVKYEAAKEGYQKMIDDSRKSKTGASYDYLYGLHFMDAPISKDRTFIAPEVMINNAKIQNYELPLDCIDFNLKTQGYINFFGGSYFAGSGVTTNDCFFSLHEVFRDGKTITDIKEIEIIYSSSDQSKAFCYKYKNDDHYYINKEDQGTTLPTGYSVKFRTEWITHPNFNGTNKMYYYEIPANPGEYALGSVVGGTGAYLNYLDISANQQMVSRTFDVEQEVTTVDTYNYVDGVGFVTSNGGTYGAVDASDSATFSLNENYSSTSGTNYNRTDDAINVNPYEGEGSNLHLEYLGEGLTSNAGTAVPSKRVYTTATTIVHDDSNDIFGCRLVTEITYVDTVTELSGVKSAVDRTILVNHYRVPLGGKFKPSEGEGDEQLIVSYKIEHYNGLSYIFNYSYYVETSKLGLNIQLVTGTTGTNVKFTFLDSTYFNVYINSSETPLSGDPTEESPIEMVITDWSIPGIKDVLKEYETDPESDE